jgi:hypothetical protein
LNILLLFLELIFKNHNFESSKHSKFLHPTRFSYKKFNEHDKLKFRDDLIYFLVKLTEGLCELKLTVSLLSLYIYRFFIIKI